MSALASTLYLFAILAVTQAYDPSEVLSADLTCCRGLENADDCNAAPDSNCVYLDADDPVAVKAGSRCLGSAFYQCKSDNINGCCGRYTTCQQPPTERNRNCREKEEICEFCEYENGLEAETNFDPNCYYFEGGPCIIHGDPHTYLFNGAHHDFHGQPATSFEGALKNQFYYVSQCASSDVEDMPYSIIATHFPFRGKSVATGIDYITIELFDENDKKYYVYLSSSIHAFAKDSIGVSSNYDHTVDYVANEGIADDLIQLESNVATDIGKRFSVNYVQTTEDRIDVTLTIDGEFDIKLVLEQQGNFIKPRYRMHYVQIEQHPKYKCYSCGLCGNFKQGLTGAKQEKMETCDGNYVKYQEGDNVHLTPEAYDYHGWTWEVGFRNKECHTYDIKDNLGNDWVWTPPCDPAIEQDVKDMCIKVRNEKKYIKKCCEVIGQEMCDQLEQNCYFDACVVVEGREKGHLPAVAETYLTAMDLICELPQKWERTPRPTRPPNTPRPTRPAHRNGRDQFANVVMVDNKKLMDAESEMMDGYRAYVEVGGTMVVATLLAICCYAMCCKQKQDEKYQAIEDPKDNVSKITI